MSSLTLFHHVRGLTPGVRELAERLRAAGHEVRTPDLFDGRTFASIEEGFAHVQSLGFDAVTARGVAAFAEHPTDAVGGLSLGAMPAQSVLQSVPGVRAGILLHAFIDPEQLDGTLPAGVPVHVHGAAEDPYFADEGDLDAARAWSAAHPEVVVTVHPGSGHLFTDSSTEDFDPVETDAVVADMTALLDRIG
ncbi:dienelactone hydrolase family protein [Brachybacterium huguangmaarense]